MSEEHPVIPTRQSAGSLMRQMLLQELTIGEGPIGQMDMLSIIANAADWLDEAVAENATTTLTDAEREAVEYFSQWCIGPSNRLERYAATLRGLLARLA